MYSEQIPDEMEAISDLLILANKYLISRLKRYCEEVLVEWIRVQTVSDLADLAVTHDCPLLKNELVAFIRDNREELSYDEELKEVLISDPDMMWRLSILAQKRRSRDPT